jgi:carbon-monoxide dehydrogenase large subunit
MIARMSGPGRVRRGRVLRREDPGLLTGATRYLEDVPQEGALHAAFARSAMAHASIVSIDASEARGLPGIEGVFTGADLGGLRMPAVEDLPDSLRRPVLADGVVRFVGEPVAVVLGRDRATAIDAAELVAIEYDERPVVVDPLRSLERDAPELFSGSGSNVVLHLRAGNDADPLVDADVVVRGRFRNQRVAPVPLEVNGALAVPGEGRLTLWIPCQATHYAREAIAGALEMDPATIRVRTAAVGGGFGAKIPAYAEQVVVAALALRVGAPVRYTETRTENMLAMTHGRDQIQEIEIGTTRDGRITGARVSIVSDLGAYTDEGATLPSATAVMLCGAYEVPRLDVEIRAVLTNKTPLGAYRGAGRPEATALLERGIDMVAAELGMDPVDVRRRNFVRSFPHLTATGATYDTGDYERALEEALRIVGYDDLRREQAERRGRRDRVLIGIGICSYVEVTGFGSEYARVSVDPDGVTLTTGSSPQGQGHETAFAQILSERLGVPFGSIAVRHSDTELVPRSEGTMASRTLQVGGSAVLGAAEALIDKARRLAGQLMEVSADDVVLSQDGRLEVVGVPGVGFTWQELAGALIENELVAGPDEALDVEHDFELEDSTYPFGTHVAVVEVDAETGDARLVRHVAVDDCGAILNPMLVEGQVHGGIAQGAAQALFEQVVFDATGTPLTSDLSTYAIPAATELPRFETMNTETPTPRNPLGAKGIGEAGTIGSTPAVQNAVVDALAHLGLGHLDMPMTPERVWRAIVGGRGATEGGRDGSTGHEGRDRGDRDADEGRLLGGRVVAPALREMDDRSGGDGAGGERGHGGGAPPLR